MADDVLKEDDDLIPVEVDENDKPLVAAEPEAKEDEEAGEDSRLADDEGEDDAEATLTQNQLRRRQRKLRRERSFREKEMTQEELRLLRDRNLALESRLAQLEQHTMQTSALTLQQMRDKHEADARMADDIRAQAITAGNGVDVVQAERIRDSALADMAKLDQQIAQARQAQQQATQPRTDPAVATLAQAWQRSNPWYDPQGRDPDSGMAREIDSELVREGFNPATREYWTELTARCADAFGEGNAMPSAKPQTPRKGPPVGTTREHATPSTRANEIRVTPQRKQAMIEAGVWDDPERRKAYLMAYRDYDTSTVR